MLDFEGFPKMARLSREVVITEKIDGTNAQVLIVELPEGAPSRRPLHHTSREFDSVCGFADSLHHS